MPGHIGFNEHAPKLFLSDFNGRTRIKLHAQSEDGTPKLALIDKTGKSIFLVSEPAVEKGKILVYKKFLLRAFGKEEPNVKASTNFD